MFFANEPILRVTAPLPEAQLVEARLINILHFQTLIASKAARMVLAAPGKLLVDFGLRRAHGAEAGLMAARASYIAGFAGTATVLAAKLFDIPVFGTMAHSYIQAHDDETVAFERFAHARPQGSGLPDRHLRHRGGGAKGRGAGAAAQGSRHHHPRRAARQRRSDRDCRRACGAFSMTVASLDVTIFASGGLEEDQLMAMAKANAPIDGFGIGTSLTTSSDAPALDCAYKLQEYAGLPRRKHSTGKATWPGRKQVWRRHERDGRMAGDTLSVEDDDQQGEQLIHQVMQAGKRLAPSPTLSEIRAHAARELELLPEPLRKLEPGATYPVRGGRGVGGSRGGVRPPSERTGTEA